MTNQIQEEQKKIIVRAVERLSNHLDDAYDCIEKYYVTLESLE